MLLKVICLNNNHVEHALTVGKEYEALPCKGDTYYQFICDTGYLQSFDKARFKISDGIVEKSSALDKQAGGQHYKHLPIQPIEYCQKNGLGYCESNVVKYVTRHKDKNGKEDIEKAIHMLELLLELEYDDS